ncbi:V-type ATPase subunit [Vagococcus elongatus]|uniref:V-type ATP synthase subunit C n=1 Tax=Vagococcus elongatus TaxID=180344 RepID=A0A430AR86_9ENTE|nr:V-type ATPase subunit [Vagococcus elongatus]RSU10543.1 V-type ATP synthase subunit C [Vagococcus elongatus]
MKETAYNQINPLIRLKETELLTTDDFEQMIQADSLEEVIDLLKNSAYEPYATMDLLRNFDKVYAKEQRKLFSWLYQIVPEVKIVHVYSSRFTFHNLKILTKAEVAKSNLDHLLLPDGLYDSSSLKSAIRTKKSNELPPTILKAVQEVSDYLQESRIMQGIDIIYDRLYLTYQRELANEIGDQNLLEEVISFIDFNNFETLARGIMRKNTPTFLSTVLSSSGSIPKEELLTYAAGSLEEFSAYLLGTKYGEALSTLVLPDKKVINVAGMDRLKDDYLTGFYSKSDTTAFGPLPLLAYMNDKQIEWKNLRLILVGKHNKFSDKQIRERMRIV